MRMRSWLLFVLLVGFVSCHCQVPCGIYDDSARVSALFEDATTISKSMNEINLIHQKEELSALDYNQLVRWIQTKENHASNIITVSAEYFLVQVSR